MVPNTGVIPQCQVWDCWGQISPSDRDHVCDPCVCGGVCVFVCMCVCTALNCWSLIIRGAIRINGLLRGMTKTKDCKL